MNQGNAGLGALWLIGAYLVFGWPVAALVGALLLLGLFEWSIRSLWRRFWWRRRSGQLSPLEEGLRSGSRGFALVVFAALAGFASHLWFKDWREFAGFIPASAQTWLLLTCVAAFVLGAVWCRAGWAGSAAARDTKKRFYAAVRLAAGGAALVYLVRLDLPALAGEPVRVAITSAGLPARLAPVFLDVIAGAAFTILLWVALVAGMRVVLLSWPRGLARRAVPRRNRAAQQVFWPGERRWLLFWRR